MHITSPLSNSLVEANRFSPEPETIRIWGTNYTNTALFALTFFAAITIVLLAVQAINPLLFIVGIIVFDLSKMENSLVRKALNITRQYLE